LTSKNAGLRLSGAAGLPRVPSDSVVGVKKPDVTIQ
jgi:hypothetical protein